MIGCNPQYQICNLPIAAYCGKKLLPVIKAAAVKDGIDCSGRPFLSVKVPVLHKSRCMLTDQGFAKQYAVTVTDASSSFPTVPPSEQVLVGRKLRLIEVKRRAGA